MVHALAGGEIVWLVCALLAAGMVTGFLSGLLGIGGGTVLVPVLYETFTALEIPDDIRMHLVLGTSFGVIVPTAIQSFRSHLAKGSVDRPALRTLAPWVVAGVLAGSVLVSSVSSRALQWVWLVCAGALAIKMLLDRDSWRLSDDLPDNWTVRVAVFAIGLLSTLMSVGGGIFVVSMFTLCGWSMLRSVATASGFGPLIAIPGLLAYVFAGFGNPELPPFSLGFVSIASVAVISPVSTLTAPLGVRCAHGISDRLLKMAFGTFLAAVCLRFLIAL